MGAILGGNSVTGSTGLLGALGSGKIKPPSYLDDDFAGGLEIIEIIDGQYMEIDKIVLAGVFMPHVPFEFGGTQQIVKNYYPGSSEPAVQILGPRESDQTIKGKFKTKRFKDLTLREAALQYQELVDAMRLRGNLVRITMGPWKRFGFIEETKFTLTRLTEIEYEIKFVITGFNMPKGYKFVSDDKEVIKPNKDITNKALSALKTMSSFPSSLPHTLIDDMNGIINGVASVVGKVTSFVDGISADLAATEAAANRAVGMIRYCRSYLSRTAQDLSFMYLRIKATPPIPGLKLGQLKAAEINAYSYVNTSRASVLSLAALMAELESKFAGMSKTVPLKRHLVSKGDTLQRISVKYYNTADHWEFIYTHNKLQSTVLSVGTVLEIPKL